MENCDIRHIVVFGFGIIGIGLIIISAVFLRDLPVVNACFCIALGMINLTLGELVRVL